MTRLVAWIGRGAAVSALLAAGLVWHGLAATRPPPEERRGFDPGATLARMQTAGGPRGIVTSLRSAGPSGPAGLRVGDLIEEVDGRAAGYAPTLQRLVARETADPLELRVRRQGALIEIHVPRNEEMR